MQKWWMIRAGTDNELIPSWLREGIVSIGWADLGDPALYPTKESLFVKADRVYLDNKPLTRHSWVNQIWRFYQEIEVGDRVVSYSKEHREYIIGTIKSEATYRYTDDNSYPNERQVTWESTRISRHNLTQAAKNSLSSVLTVFRIDAWGQELDNALHGTIASTLHNPEHEDIDVLLQELQTQAQAMIEDKIDALNPWDMQDLIDGLLHALGYLTKVADEGINLLAFKDELGFEKPIIKVAIHHRTQVTGSEEIRHLLGAHPLEANSLIVSTGGFTTSALRIAQQNNVKAIDLEQLGQLIVQTYEKLPNTTRALLPLRAFYLPEG